MKKKAVVLLSGGIDSAATLYYAKKRGFRCFCLTFDYGQRHKKEINSARRIANAAGSEYKVLKINLPWKGSSLIDKKRRIPGRRSLGTMSREIPSTYVPSRNTIFISYAASFAESINARKIFIGANAVDFSGYPDCRPLYFRNFNRTLKAGTKKKNISIETPLINKKKSEIITLAKSLHVPLELSWSCYEGKGNPCGLCDSCRIRSQAFRKAGFLDSVC